METEAAYMECNQLLEDRYKQIFADALYHAKNLLHEENVISFDVSGNINKESIEIGQEIFNRVKELFREIYLSESAEECPRLDIKPNIEDINLLLLPDNSEENSEEIHEESDEDFQPEIKQKMFNSVPLDVMIKTVRLAKLHPKWKLKTLQNQGTRQLKSLSQLKKWKNYVENRGSFMGKYEKINEGTIKKFLQARAKNQIVTKDILQAMALEASNELISNDFKFTASDSWLDRFKKKYDIQYCKLPKSNKSSITEYTYDIVQKGQSNESLIVTLKDLK